MKRGLLLLGIFCWCVHVGRVAAQDSVRAVFVAERGRLLVGEPVELTLIVEAPAGTQVELADIPLDWPPFQVLQAGEIIQERSGTRTIYRQTFRVTLWATGDFTTPETWIIYRNAGIEAALRTPVEPAYFTVPSVLSEDDLTPRPYTAPVARFYLPTWAIAAAVMAISLGGAWGWRSYRQARAARAPKPVPLPAREAILEELRALGGQSLPPDQVVVRSGDCLRRYVETEFSLPASEMTTQELMNSLEQRAVLADRGLTALEGILARVDLVKFAAAQYERSEALQVQRAALDWVDHAVKRWSSVNQDG